MNKGVNKGSGAVNKSVNKGSWAVNKGVNKDGRAVHAAPSRGSRDTLHLPSTVLCPYGPTYANKGVSSLREQCRVPFRPSVHKEVGP